MPDTAPQTPPPRNSIAAVLRWLLVGAIGMTVLAIVGAHTPMRVRLLGLFSLVYGLAGGLFLGKVAGAFHLRRSGAALVASFLLIAAAEAGLTLESYRLWRAGQMARLERAAEEMRPLPTVPTSPPPPSGLPSLAQRQAAEVLLDAMRDDQVSFRRYLALRLTRRGDWPAPWPAVIWSLELLLGSAAGAWFARRIHGQSRDRPA